MNFQDNPNILLNIPSSVMVDINDIVIYVDPLDGTGEFVSGRLQCVSVIIGIAHKGRALGGVIYRPFPCDAHPYESMYGVIGVGSFRDHQR